MATKKKAEGTPVRPRDKVEFTWNGKDKFHKNGEKEMLHPVQAEKLEKKGFGKISGEVRVQKIRENANSENENENV